MSRVFIIERSKHNVSTANAFGALVTLFPRTGDRPSIWRSTECASRVIAELRRYRFDPQQDFILLCGSQIMLSIVVAVVAVEYGQFTALAFNTHDDVRDYEPVILGEMTLCST